MSSHAPVRYSLGAPSAAALASLSGPFDTGDVCFVAGLTDFTYDKTSVAAVDNVNVIDGPASVGRWLRGPAPASVGDAAIDPASGLGKLYATLDAATGLTTGRSALGSVTPTGVAATDTANLQAALNAMAGVGEVRMGPGTFAINTPLTVPDNTILIAHPNTSIVSTITPTGGGGHARAVFTRDDLSTPSTTTTLTADAQIGATVLAMTSVAGMSVGSTIYVTNGNNQTSTYTIRAINSLNVTVDRPFLRKWNSGAIVGVFTQPRNIRLIGNGAVFTGGTGDRAISLVAAWNCIVEGWRLESPLFGDYNISCDTGSRFSVIRDCYANNAGTPAFAIESSEECLIERCSVITSASPDCGILVQAGYDATVKDCVVTGGVGAGLLIGYLTDAVGSRGVRVIGGAYNGNGIGIQVGGGSTDVDIIGANCAGNVNEGVLVQATSGNQPHRVRVNGGRYNGNGLHILIDAALGCSIDNAAFTGVTGNAAVQVQGSGEMRVSKSYFEENAAGVGVIANLASTLYVESCKVTSTYTTAPSYTPSLIRTTLAGSKTYIKDTVLQAAAGHAILVQASGGTTWGQNILGVSGEYGVYTGGLGIAGVFTGDTLCDFAACSTQYLDDTNGSHTVAAR